MIVREEDPGKLLHGVCDGLVRGGCYKGAWIALLDTRGGVESLEHAGQVNCIGPHEEAIRQGTWPPAPRRALDTMEPLVVEDPARDCKGCSLARACRGLCTMISPMSAGDRLVGVMGACAARRGISDLEGGLFHGLSQDLARAVFRIRKLERTELRFKALVEQLPAIVYMAYLEEGTPMLYVSPQVRELLGYEPGQFTGDPGMRTRCIHPGDRQRVLLEIERCRQRAGTFYAEYRMIGRDGRTVWFRDQASVIENRKGEPEYLQGVMLDISSEKSVQEEKRKMQAQVLRMQKMDAIGTLVAGVAHDFNNMLTAIQGYVELALMDLEDGGALHAQLSQVYRTSLRAADLVKKLLIFSKRQSLYMMAVDLGRLVNDTMGMLGRVLGENIRVQASFPRDLWPVWGDLANLEQVLVNLGINAKDAMPGGGELVFSGENLVLPAPGTGLPPGIRPGRFVHLVVRDTGVGMTPEVMEHIFEPFFTTKELGHGSGLGLAVTYGIVKEHGGWIQCESRPGEGTAFHVYLPAADPSLLGYAHKGSLKAILRGMDGASVLVVEDEDAVCRFAVEVLSVAGYEVRWARCAGEAREVFERGEAAFDVLFSDVVLPDGSGLDLAREFREKRPGLKVIFTTGYMDQGLSAGLEEQADHPLLQKPFSVSDLLDAVSCVLSKEGHAGREGPVCL